MTSLNPDWKKDARLRLQIEDSLKTAMFSARPPQRSILWSVCVHKALCLRHIHHIQAAPIHHIQAKQESADFCMRTLIWMTIMAGSSARGHLGLPFWQQMPVFHHKKKLTAGLRVTSRLGIPQSDEQVLRTGMSRPHPSLERRENGSFRLITTIIRVDHTKF